LPKTFHNKTNFPEKAANLSKGVGGFPAIPSSHFFIPHIPFFINLAPCCELSKERKKKKELWPNKTSLSSFNEVNEGVFCFWGNGKMTSFTRIVPEHVVWGVELCGQAGRQAGKGFV